MNTANQPAPLRDDEISRLDELLAEVDPDDSMMVEELDGFLAALACCPVPIPASEWLAEVLGHEAGDTDGDAPLLKLIERHRQAVAGMLYDGEGFSPVLAHGEDGVAMGNAWAIGFVRGMALRPDAWAPLDDDDDHAEALDPVMRLVAEAEAELDDSDEDTDPDADESVPGARGGLDGTSLNGAHHGDGFDDGAEDWEPIADDERDELLHQMFDGVQDVFDFFREARERNLAPAAPIRRGEAKLGRNDPCRCGSGRKFKNCCGGSQH